MYKGLSGLNKAPFKYKQNVRLLQNKTLQMHTERSQKLKKPNIKNEVRPRIPGGGLPTKPLIYQFL